MMRIQIILLYLLAVAIRSKGFGPSAKSCICRATCSQRSSSAWQLHSTVAHDLPSLTVVELKELLKDRGCKVSGRKSELIERLEAVYALNAEEVAPSSGKQTTEVKPQAAQEKTVDDDFNLDAEFDLIFESKDESESSVSTSNNICTDESTDADYATTSSPGGTVHMQPDEIRRLTSNQLKSLLKAKGCNISGSKAELIERLTEVVASKNQDNADVAATKSPTGSGFEDMKIPSPLLHRLRYLGFKEPTPIQKDAIPVALNGFDVMGLAQTGTGKTLAFGIPLVSKLLDGGEYDARGENSIAPKTVSALVLAPTRELANQIAGELQTLTKGSPVTTYVIFGGVKLETHVGRLERGVHILVATPGRLVDLMNRRAVSLKDTRFLVLDESDMMLDMGFAPDLKKIAAQLPLERQTMLFSATMSRDMAGVAKLYLTNPVRVEVASSGTTADNISQEVHFIQKMDKMSKLTSLIGKHEGERTLIFGRTKHGMEKLCKRLNYAGVKATSIHGDKSQSQRERAIKDFKSGSITVLVATDVAARGLDIPEVKYVYNYELPDKAENYIHRIGRTARAGKDGTSISFCSMEEMDGLSSIEELMGVPIPIVSGTPWVIEERRFRSGRDKQSNKNVYRGYRKLNHHL